MIEVEVFGVGLAPEAPPADELERLCVLCAESRGVGDGHVAVEYVSSARIAELNERHRGKAEPTDVLSFPIDGIDGIDGSSEVDGVDGSSEVDGIDGSSGIDGRHEAAPEPRELGDIVICPAHTADLREAIVHGMLHLLGMDHETDDGEMLALQDRLMGEAGS